MHSNSVPTEARRPDSPRATSTGPRYQPLVLVLLAVCLGIIADRYAAWPMSVWWTLVAAGWLVWLACWWKRLDRSAALALALCLAALGGGWHHTRWNLFAADDLGTFASGEPTAACVEAIAVRGARFIPAKQFDPLNAVPRGERSRLELRVLAVRDGERWLKASGRTRLTVEGHLLGVHAGDRLRVLAQLSAPAEPMNPGEFDFARHARADRQLSQLWADAPDCVTLLEPSPTWTFMGLLDRLRGRGNALLWKHLDRERYGLAAAILLGTREQLDDDHVQAYFLSGMVHVLSISGLHVGILAAGLFWVLRAGPVRRGTALVAVALLTIFYAAVIEAEAPAVRATIVVLCACLSMAAGRPVLAFNSLAAAALVVLAMNPADLFRIGPQLSFLATAVLAWSSHRRRQRAPPDPLLRLIARTRPWPVRAARAFGNVAGHALLLAGCVWLVTLPLVMTQFHLLSPATVLLTPVLSLPIAGSLLFGFGVLLLGWLLPPLGAACGWMCDRCLWFTDGCIAWGNRCPGSHFWVLGPDQWWVVSFYLLLGLWLVLPRWRPPTRWAWAILVAWTTVGLLAPALQHWRRDALHCGFLSMGHGCAVVVELPGGKTLLYDAGRLGSPLAGSRSLASYLWWRGITHVDAVVISHADVDHYNALPRLLDQFSIGKVYVSPRMRASTSGAVRLFLSTVQQAGVPVAELYAGQPLALDPDCSIQFLHPPQAGVEGSDNANSLVLLLEHRGRKILLPGDLESPGMERLLAQPPCACDVLLVPHHGSARSNPPGFAAWSTPRWVVISGGHNHNLPAVAEAYRAQGAEVFHTAVVGAVSVNIDQSRIGVEGWRKPKPGVQ
jgi:competence protein ComEC